MQLLVILVRDNYTESTASCPISKASIFGFSFSLLFFPFFIFPGDISDFFSFFVSFWEILEIKKNYPT